MGGREGREMTGVGAGGTFVRELTWAAGMGDMWHMWAAGVGGMGQIWTAGVGGL